MCWDAVTGELTKDSPVVTENKEQKAVKKSGFSRQWQGAINPLDLARKYGYAALIIISVFSAAVMLIAPPKIQFMLIMIFPGVVGLLLVMRNPYLGVLVFFLFQFLRPQEYIPALRPLRLGMLLGVVSLVSWAFNLAVKKQRLYWPKFNWIFAGYIGVICVTVFTAANNRMAYDVAHMMIVFFIIFLIASNTSKSMKHINLMVWMLLLVHLYLAFEGITGGGRANNSLMGDENDFALALNTMLPFTYFSFEYAKNKLQKFAGLTMLIVFSLGTVSSMSRGGWVGFMAVVIYIILQSKRKLVSLASVAVLGVAIAAFAPAKYWQEIETISDTSESTAQTRLNYWNAALRMFIDYPVVGVGANNGGIRMPQYVTGFRNAGTQWGRTFHGTLPQVLAELGGLGMITFLAMLFYAIMKLRHIRKRTEETGDTDYKLMANSLIGGFVGYMVTATFLSTLYYPQIWTLYTIMVMLMYQIHVADAKKMGNASVPDSMVETELIEQR